MEKLKYSDNIKKIGVFTSGGDAPGMNAAIRAVVRIAEYYGIEVVGFVEGYNGLIENNYLNLTNRDVAGILHQGGTMLKSARSKSFKTKEGREKAYQTIKQHHVDGLIAIGGDGTLRGLKIFFEEYNIPGIGIPGTIDNDLNGTDFTLGFDTAVNTVVSLIDKIRDTANSHNRVFFVEVMGRDSGFIALNSAIASGASAMMLPETDISVDQLIEMLNIRHSKGKKSSIVIVSEGNINGNAMELTQRIKEKSPDFHPRVTVLGHLQRGGSPSASDRILAARYAQFAIELLLQGENFGMAGVQKNKMVFVPLEKATKMHPPLSEDLLRLSDVLSL
ncbi:MAG: 6-phosphofructokinase [Flavobacteriales bacterium]